MDEDEEFDALRPEYSASDLRGGVRGKYWRRGRRKYVRYLIVAICVLFAAWAVFGRSTSSPDTKADSFIIYSIDGRDNESDRPLKLGATYRGYPLLGQVDVTDAKTRKAIVAAFNEGVARAVTPANCFWPRHAILTKHGKHTTEFVICFECSQHRVYVDGQHLGTRTISDFPLSKFNEVLTQAGVKLAPSAFVDPGSVTDSPGVE